MKGPYDKPTGPIVIAAMKKFTELMEMANANKGDQGNAVQLIRELHGQHLKSNGRTASLRIPRDTCKSVLEHFGDKTPSKFKVAHIVKWLGRRRSPDGTARGRAGKWNETYRNCEGIASGRGVRHPVR